MHGRGADFAFPVKANQPGLFDALDALPWRGVPVSPEGYCGINPTCPARFPRPAGAPPRAGEPESAGTWYSDSRSCPPNHTSNQAFIGPPRAEDWSFG